MESPLQQIDVGLAATEDYFKWMTPFFQQAAKRQVRHFSSHCT
jgi:hypothetical protein